MAAKPQRKCRSESPERYRPTRDLPERVARAAAAPNPASGIAGRLLDQARPGGPSSSAVDRFVPRILANFTSRRRTRTRSEAASPLPPGPRSISRSASKEWPPRAEPCLAARPLAGPPGMPKRPRGKHKPRKLSQPGTSLPSSESAPSESAPSESASRLGPVEARSRTGGQGRARRRRALALT